MESEVRSTMPDLPPTSEIARLARSPSALLTHLSNLPSEDDEAPDGSFQPPAGANGAGEGVGETGAGGSDGAGGTGGAGGIAPDGGAETSAAATNGKPAVAPQPADVAVPADPTLN
jgi:hypothetical protein